MGLVVLADSNDCHFNNYNNNNNNKNKNKNNNNNNNQKDNIYIYIYIYTIDKCAIAVMKGGKQIKSQKMPIDDKTSIQSLDEAAAYKYLGIDETTDILHSAMKEKVAKENYH